MSSSTAPAVVSLQDLVSLVDGVSLRTDEITLPTFCDQHEAPLVVFEVLGAAGLYQHTHCPFASRNECSHQGHVALMA